MCLALRGAWLRRAGLRRVIGGRAQTADHRIVALGAVGSRRHDTPSPRRLEEADPWLRPLPSITAPECDCVAATPATVSSARRTRWVRKGVVLRAGVFAEFARH